MATPTDVPSGFVGSLTPPEEEKLLQFWKLLIQSWDPELNNPGSNSTSQSPSVSSPSGKSHRRFLSFSRSQPVPTEEETAAIPPNLLSGLKALDASPVELKSVSSLLSKIPGDQLRAAYLTILKQDHPDAFVLRFIRAEKWNLPKAWIKLASALHWRVNEYHVDEEILLKGEDFALEKANQAEDSTEKRDGEGFILQARLGKGYSHGCDKFGRPVCVIRVRTHEPGAQTQKGLNDYVIQSIETGRMLQVFPVESLTIVFDLTSFSLSNWEFPPVKFIIDSFQENYPESLGAMVFYNAPWIFFGFWKLIQGILDPVIAAKVHFLNGPNELEQLIPREHITKELGGEEDWEYSYPEPHPHENDRLLDVITRQMLLEERNKLGDDLFKLTIEWISTPGAESVKERRNAVIAALHENYWKLDPYVRSRTYLDRIGVIQEGGKIEFYPPASSNNGLQAEVEPKILSEEVGSLQVGAVAA